MVSWRFVLLSLLVAQTMCVFDLTASLDSESEIIFVSSRASETFCGVSQTLSFSEKRGASGTLLREQSNRTRMSVEATSVKSAPKRTPVKAVPACLRNRTPPPFAGTPLQQTPTWPGPSSDPSPEFTEAEPQCWRIGAVAHPTWQWCLRECALIQPVGGYLKRGEDFNVATIELQHFLLSPEDDAGCICRKCVR